MTSLAIEILQALEEKAPKIGQPRLKLLLSPHTAAQLRADGPVNEWFYNEELDAWTFHYAEVVIDQLTTNWRIL